MPVDPKDGSRVESEDEGLDLPRFLLVRQLVVSVVLVVLVSGSFYFIVRDLIVRVWADFSIAVAGHLTSEARHAGVELPPPPSRRATLAVLAQRQMADMRVARVRIVDRGRLLVFSTDEEAVPRALPQEDGWARALEGAPSSHLQAGRELRDGNRLLRMEELLVTYVPIRLRGRVVGAYEIAQRADELNSRLDLFRTIVLAGSAAIVLALVLAVLPIARRAGRLLGEERSVRRRYEAQLKRAADHLEREVTRQTSELREERDRLRAIVDHVPSAFVLVDAQRRVQLATRSFEHVAGVSAEQAKGMRCADQVAPLIGCTECLLVLALETGEAQRVERRVTRSGEARWLDHSVIPVKPGPGGAVALEVVTDITERKRVEEGMVRSAKLATLGEMAAVVAHEIRNSLNSAKLLVQMMSEEPDQPPGKQPLSVALASMARAERLIRNLLQFARPMPLQPVFTDASDVVRQASAFARSQFDQSGVQLGVVAGGPLVARFDPDHVREALINLLLNAMQATARGGRVDLAVERARAPAELLAAAAEAPLPEGTEAVRFVVHDEGRGMDPEEAARAFDPFFTTRQDGTGLGLPTVRRIANDHGGCVTLESRKGAGTTVSLWLPLPVEASDV